MPRLEQPLTILAMKKHFIYMLAASLVLAAPAVTFTSCGDDDPEEIPGGGSGDDADDVVPDGPSAQNPLTSREQKQKLEAIAKGFMAQVPSSDFNGLADLSSYICNHYVDNDRFDHSVVTNWFDTVLEGMTKYVTHKTESKYGWLYDCTYYNRLITLSNFKGHFTAGAKKWTREDANDLQFIFKDQDGKQCVLSVKQEGSVKKAYITDDEDYRDCVYDSSTGKGTDYVDKYKYYVNVPERVIVTLTQDGVTRVNSVTNINHSKFNGPEYDLSRDGVDVSTTTSVNDYSWIIDHAGYSAQEGKVAVKGCMKKGNTTLISFEASGAGLKLTNDDVQKVGSVNVSVDVMGKMQIKATCADAMEFDRKIEEAYDNCYNQRTFESCIGQANSLLDCKVYYDGTNVEQASVKLEVFKEPGYNEYWDFEPAIYFNDNSSYGISFDDYFDETSFKSVIDTFESLLRGYEKLGNKFEY